MKLKLYLICFCLLTYITAGAQAWNLKKNKDGVKVYTKTNPNSPFDLLKAECDIAVDLNKMLNLIFDVKIHHTWVYSHVKSEMLKSISPLNIIYYGETYAPWPVSNRDMVVHLTAITDSLTGICTIKGISEPSLFPLVDGKIRVVRSTAVWKLIPLENKTTRVIYTLDIDPGGSLPAWLVNFASIEGPYLSFLKMRSLLEP